MSTDVAFLQNATALTNTLSVPARILYPASELSEIALSHGDRWVVPGVLQRGAVTTIFGHGGLGKTWLVLDLLLNVALRNESFLGFPIKSEGNVVFVDLETGEVPPLTIAERIKALSPHQAPDNLFVVAGDALLTSKGIDTKLLHELLEEIEPSVVAVDSFTAAHIGDTNAAERVFTTMRVFREIAQRYNAAVVVVDHTSKSDARSNADDAMPLGSVVKHNATRLAILFRQLDVPLPGDYYEILLIKSNNLPPEQVWVARTLKRESRDGKVSHVLADEVSVQAVIAEYLAVHPEATAKEVGEALEERGFELSRRTLYRRVKEARLMLQHQVAQIF